MLVHRIELARELAQTAPPSDYWDGKSMFGIPDPYQPGGRMPVPQWRRQLEAFVRANATTVRHPSGTCKMGRDRFAVVDPQLRVHGIEGLRLADVSVMPTITSGNTNAPSTMIAEKAADMILGSMPRSGSGAGRTVSTPTRGNTGMGRPPITKEPMVDRLVAANIRTVEGGLRFVSRWCELSAVA